MTGQILNSGYVIGEKYRLDRPIGRGGFSTVYQAVHTAMNRTVAIKVFDPADPANTSPTEAKKRADRFVHEARVISQLEHANTITIHDFGVDDDGKAFLVMEFVEGLTLGQLLDDEGPLTQQDTVTIFLQVLGSLEEAHHQHILHRDLKPANIMLAENFKGRRVVKVLDFGIARTLKGVDDEASSDSDQFSGTPRYAAPEQLLRGELALATDIFAVGSLMWACLVGRPMVPRGTFKDYMGHAVSARPWKLPEQLDIDNELRRIVNRAVRKSPADRFDDAASMLQALEQCTDLDDEDLPELQAPPLNEGHDIFDPNLDASEDPDNFFLNPDSAPKDSDLDPAPLPNDESSRPIETAPPELELELDRPDDAPPHNETETTSSSVSEIDASLAQPNRPDDTNTGSSRPRSLPIKEPANPHSDVVTVADLIRRPQTIVGIIAFLLALLIAVAVVISGDESSPQPVDASASVDSASNDATADERSDDTDILDELESRSTFSVDAILMAIRTQNWRVDESRDPTDLRRYRYQPAMAYRGDFRVDLSLYETRNDEARRELEQDIEYPDQSITFDHIVVRLRPRNTEDHEAVIALREFLEEFRALAGDDSD